MMPQLKPVNPQSIDLSQYEFDEGPSAQSDSSDTGFLRGAGRTIARGTESLLGLPGDIASTALGVGNYLTGGTIPTYETVQKNLPISLPTSQDVRGVTRSLTGKTLEPQTNKERLWDEFIGDLTTLAIPVKGKIPFKSAALRALSANTAGYLGEQVAGEQGKAAGKIGTYLLSGLYGGRKVLGDIKTNSYKVAEDAIKDNPKYNAVPLRNEVSRIDKWAKSGLGTPEKKMVGEHIDKLKSFYTNKNGRPTKISVKQLWESKKDINNLIYDHTTPPHAKYQLGELNKILNSKLQEYGKGNPEFLGAFSKAEDIHRGLTGATKITQFLKDTFDTDKLLTNGLAKGLFANAFGLKKTLIGGAAGIPAKEIAKSIELITRSAEARKYYKQVLHAAAIKNKVGVIRALSKLNEAADKYESENPQPNLRPVDLNNIDLSQYEFAD